jgi:S1-C subfamily serine protease
MNFKRSQKNNILKSGFLVILAAAIGCAATFIFAELTPVQVENAKKATALVRIKKDKEPSMGSMTRSKEKPIVNGTAFCIDATGWFITCAHLANRAVDGKLNLILNAGRKDQRILEAKVIRADKEKDLALLKTVEHGPFNALPIGTADRLVETARITAFGYPFGESLALAKDAYPEISVSIGAITSLRKKEGKLELIQLDASLNPGNSGGPVLDSDGRVVGIVNSGIEGAAMNFAIPVSFLQEFLPELEVEFIPPNLDAENMKKPATFKASVLMAMGSNADYRAELTVTAAGIQSKVPMKRGADGFSAEVVPAPPQKDPFSISIVEYQMIVTKDGKPVKRIVGSIPIINMPAVASQGFGTQQTEVTLPDYISNVAVGGGGRFLILYLRTLHQLAIFDTSVARIVKYLPTGSQKIVFTAGAEQLMVGSVAQNVISSYSLKTFEKEATATMPVTGSISAIIMGAHSQGPLLVVSGTENPPEAFLSLVDPATLALKRTWPRTKLTFLGIRDTFQIRASADGKVFSTWDTASDPSGLRTMTFEGNDVQMNYLHEPVAPVVPGPDGRVMYTAKGLYTVEAKLIGQPESYNQGGLRIPAIQGNYYIEIDGKGRMTLCLPGAPNTRIPIPKLDDMGIEDFWQRRDENSSFTLDKRFHFIPDAHLIIYIPNTNDRLLLRQIDPGQAIKDAKMDYLSVSSSPVTSAAANSSFVYQIQVESNRGGVEFQLVSSPRGMKLTPSGKLTWTTGATPSEENVIIRITDASDKEFFHAFKIYIR